MRITTAAVVVTAVAVGAAGWLLVRSVEDAQFRDVNNAVDTYLERVATRLEAGLDPDEAVAAAGGVTAPMLLRVTDDRGNVVAWTGDEIRAQVETVARAVETPGGRFTIIAGAPVDQVNRNVETLTERLAVGLPALTALVGVIAWVLVGRALRPVEAMRAEAERITGSTMHRRLPEPATDDEVGRLARTMNTMLGRLEAAAVQQRAFISDASHELRSPVATLRAGLEAARTRPGPAGWEERVDGLLVEESRLESLLDDLLLLAAHDENGPITAAATPVDLTALAREEAQRQRRVPVDVVDAPPGSDAVIVTGVRRQLARALGNVIDNAARHATSVVQVSVSGDHDTARLVVDDDGPGIPPADRERVFERFTRLDGGRARHDGGSGLGLSVVRSILTGHHGTIRVDDSPLGGARVVTALPLAPRAP